MDTSPEEIDHFITIFQNATSLEEKLQLFCERSDVQSFIQDNLVIKTNKSSKEANRLKEEGNRLFVAGKFQQSLERYNQALLTVDQDTPPFSLILANRSAVFFKLKEYQLCLDDINLSLDKQYPPHLTYKLQDRRARCFYFLGDKNQFLENLNILETMSLDDESINEKIGIMVEELKKLPIQKMCQKKITKQTKSKTKCEQVNSNFEGFSSSVEMSQTRERGRFIIAREDIPAGTVIGAEDPIAYSVLPSMRSKLCSSCLSPLALSFFPCPGCCEARFCSLQCWRKALKGGHRLECGLQTDLASLLRHVKGGETAPEYYQVCLMAIGDLSVENILEVNIHQPLDMSRVPNQEEGRLESIFNLVSVEDQRSLETDFWIFLTVSFFVKVLEQKKFFTDIDQVNKNVNNFSTQQLKVGAFLAKVLRILQLNVHSVMQAVIKDKESFSMESIGSAIYASMAFLNHSCNPNTIKYWEGNRMVLVASQPIRRGQEVTDNYGMHFLNSNRSVRRKWLQEYYWFHCKCPACEADFPIKEKLPENVTTVLSGSKLSSSEVKTTLSKLVKRTLETASMESMMGDDIGGALRSYCDILGEMYRVTEHPWAGLVMPEQMLWKAVRTMNGNKYYY